VHLRDRPSLFKNSLKVSMLLQIFMTLLQNTKFDFEKKKKKAMKVKVVQLCFGTH